MKRLSRKLTLALAALFWLAALLYFILLNRKILDQRRERHKEKEVSGVCGRTGAEPNTHLAQV